MMITRARDAWPVPKPEPARASDQSVPGVPPMARRARTPGAVAARQKHSAMQPYPGPCNQRTIKLPSSVFLLPQDVRPKGSSPQGPKGSAGEARSQPVALPSRPLLPWMQVMYRGRLDNRDLSPGATAASVKRIQRKHRLLPAVLVDVSAAAAAYYAAAAYRWQHREGALLLCKGTAVEPLFFHQPTHLIPWGDERSKLTTESAARHSTLAPSQKQQEQDQRKELHNLQQQQQHGQDWDHEGTSPYQDDSTGANGQVKGDGDAPLPGNSTASVGVEGPDVLLEEQDEVVALLVQVNERHEKQLAFERVLQERDGFWRKRHVTLGASSSDSIDVIVDASLWRSVSDKVAYNSEKSPSSVPTPQLKQAEIDSIQLSSNSSSSEKSLAVSPEACVSNVLEQAETHNVEPSQRPDEDKEEAPPQIVNKEDCHKLVESQSESQGSSHEVKLPKREYSYKPSSYSYREYHSNKRYSERNSQSSGSSNIRFNNQVTGCLLKNQMNSQKNVHVSDRSKSRYICQSNSHKVQQNDLKQQYDGGSNRESYGQENDQTLDKQPNNRPNGKPQTQSHGHPGNQSNCQARNKSSRQFNSQSSYHPNNQHRGRSNHYPSSQYNNQYKDRPDSRRDGNPNNQSTCQSSTYLNTKNANRHTSQSDNQPRCQSNRSNDFSEKNVQEHLHRTPRSSLPYCCQNVNERACSPADLSATPRGHQKQEPPPPPPPPPRPYSAPRPLQSDQNNKNHEKSTTSQQSEAQRPTRKDRRRNGASSNGSRKSAVSPSGGTVPLQQERTQAVACRKPIPLKMFWESNDMTIFRKRTS